MSRNTVPATPKGEATRARILEVAAARFAARGYAGTTFTELIAASGLTKGAFYFWFPSKEQLAAAVLEFKQRQIRERLEARGAALGSAADQLLALPDTMRRIQHDDPSTWAIARLARDVAQVPGLAGPVRAVLDRWIETGAELIRRAQAEGGVRTDIDPETTAAVLVAAYDGIKGFTQAMGGHEALDGPEFTERIALFTRLLDTSLRVP